MSSAITDGSAPGTTQNSSGGLTTEELLDTLQFLLTSSADATDPESLRRCLEATGRRKVLGLDSRWKKLLDFQAELPNNKPASRPLHLLSALLATDKVQRERIKTDIRDGSRALRSLISELGRAPKAKPDSTGKKTGSTKGAAGK